MQDGSDDLMGKMDFPLAKELLDRSTVGEDSLGGVFQWCPLCGEDELGRAAKGRVKVGLVFRPLDGSLRSISRYIEICGSLAVVCIEWR